MRGRGADAAASAAADDAAECGQWPGPPSGIKEGGRAAVPGREPPRGKGASISRLLRLRCSWKRVPVLREEEPGASRKDAERKLPERKLPPGDVAPPP